MWVCDIHFLDRLTQFSRRIWAAGFSYFPRWIANGWETKSIAVIESLLLSLHLYRSKVFSPPVETLNINDIFIQLFIKNGCKWKNSLKNLRDRQVIFVRWIDTVNNATFTSKREIRYIFSTEYHRNKCFLLLVNCRGLFLFLVCFFSSFREVVFSVKFKIKLG